MLKFSRLSAYKIWRIILCFSEDITASSASKFLKINRRIWSVNHEYMEQNKGIKFALVSATEAEMDEMWSLFTIKNSNIGFGGRLIIKLEHRLLFVLGLENIAIWIIF